MNGDVALLGGVALALALAVLGYRLASPGSEVRRAADRYLRWLDAELTAIRSPTRAIHVLVAQLLGTVALLGVAAGYNGYAALLVPAPFALTGPMLRRARARRAATIEQQLGGWLVAMSNVLKVSGSVSDALAQSVELTRAPLAEELDRCTKEIRLGAPVDAALRSLTERVGSPMLAAAVTTLIIGRRTGGALPTLLDESARASREHLRLERVFRQHLAAARLQFFALSLGPPLLIGGLDRMQPGFFDPLLGSPLGLTILVGAGALWLVAILIARRVMMSAV